MRLRRVAVVALIYLVGAFAVDLLLQALVPVLVLPPLFITLGRALLGIGFMVTLGAAWTWEGADGGGPGAGDGTERAGRDDPGPPRR